MKRRYRHTPAMRLVSLIVPEPFEECVSSSRLAAMGQIPLILFTDKAAVVNKNDVLALASDQSVDAGFHTRCACLSRLPVCDHWDIGVEK